MLRSGGYRAVLVVPLLARASRDRRIIVTRRHRRPFSDKQIELVSTFADQAVIAIENTRLLSELRRPRSANRSAADRDRRRAEGHQPLDLRPPAVLDTLARDRPPGSAKRTWRHLRRRTATVSAPSRPRRSRPNLIEDVRSIPITPGRGTVVGRAAAGRQPRSRRRRAGHPEYGRPSRTKAGGYRTIAGRAAAAEGDPIGVIVTTAHEVRPFTDKQIELVKTFADQAVIAIENVRLFEEVQARTAELREVAAAADRDRRRAQGHQPLDLRSADRARHAGRVGGAAVRRRQGRRWSAARTLALAASSGLSPEVQELLVAHPFLPNRGTSGRVRWTAHLHIPDVLADPEYTYPRAQTIGGYRTLGVPLLREDELIGVILLPARRCEPFADKQIELATFADQAVIAIENARLFERAAGAHRRPEERFHSRPPPPTSSRRSAAPRSICLLLENSGWARRSPALLM